MNKFRYFLVFLQGLSKAVGPPTSPSCSGCWCRWSCGCFSCLVRRALRRSSTAPCRRRQPGTAGVTSSTASRLRCALLRETLVWQKSCGRPVRDWWNWPDVTKTSFMCWDSSYLWLFKYCRFPFFLLCLQWCRNFKEEFLFLCESPGFIMHHHLVQLKMF